MLAGAPWVLSRKAKEESLVLMPGKILLPSFSAKQVDRFWVIRSERRLLEPFCSVVMHWDDEGGIVERKRAGTGN